LLIWIPLATARLGHQDRELQSETQDGVILGQYIVVFNKNADPDKLVNKAIAAAGRNGDSPSVIFRYSHVINGVAMNGLSQEAVNLLAQDQDIVQVGEVSTQLCGLR